MKTYTSNISPWSNKLVQLQAQFAVWFSTHHRINQLDTIVLRRVVTGSDHNANPLSTEFLGA